MPFHDIPSSFVIARWFIFLNYLHPCFFPNCRHDFEEKMQGFIEIYPSCWTKLVLPEKIAMRARRENNISHGANKFARLFLGVILHFLSFRNIPKI